MRIGLVGPPQSGKTSVFRILTGTATADTLATHQPEIGVYALPDPRLVEIAAWAECDRVTPARIELWDPPSHWTLTDDRASQLIGELRTMDGLLCVIPAFDVDRTPFDWSVVFDRVAHLERTLMMADLQVLQGRYERLQKEYAKRHEETLLQESQYVRSMMQCLQDERPLRAEPWPDAAVHVVRGYGLLSLKPIVYLFNIAERALGQVDMHEVLHVAGNQRPWAGWEYTCARLELELIRMDTAERTEWMQMYTLTELLPERLVDSLLHALGLIRFYTVLKGEARVWLLPQGATALDAAGCIHTDMARGFIRAEVLHYTDIAQVESFRTARQQGRLRVEGRDYIVRDGDILTIRFSV